MASSVGQLVEVGGVAVLCLSYYVTADRSYFSSRQLCRFVADLRSHLL